MFQVQETGSKVKHAADGRIQYHPRNRESLKTDGRDYEGGMTRTGGKSEQARVGCDRMEERLIESRWRGVAIELHKDLVGTG